MSAYDDIVVDLEPGVYAISVPVGHFYFNGVTTQPVRRLRLVVAEPETVTLSVNQDVKPYIRQLTTSDPVDGVPHEALLTDPRPLTLQEEIARFFGHLQRSQNSETESWEDADDFDIDDDDLPISQYEVPYGDEETPPNNPVRGSDGDTEGSTSGPASGDSSGTGSGGKGGQDHSDHNSGSSDS